MTRKTGTEHGTSLSMVLFLIFLVLKLTDNISWSWWWVTSPLWIGLVVLIPLALLAGILRHPR